MKNMFGGGFTPPPGSSLRLRGTQPPAQPAAAATAPQAAPAPPARFPFKNSSIPITKKGEGSCPVCH